MLTASYLNTYVRDNIAWMATDSPACRAYNSANLSVANTTDTALTLNSERYDNAAVHSTSSNTSRFTVPTGGGGKWLAGGGVQYAVNGTGVRALHLQVNAATRFVSQTIASASAGIVTDVFVTSQYALSAADYFEAITYQSSGGALNVLASANTSPEFWCSWQRT